MGGPPLVQSRQFGWGHHHDNPLSLQFVGHVRTIPGRALVRIAGPIGYHSGRTGWGPAMGKLKSMQELFEGRLFDREVIILCVRWYLRLKLSLRDLVEMMAERGLSMAHTTILRWVQRTHRSSRNAGENLPGQSGGHGGLTRHTSRSGASGATCTVPLIGRAGRSISG